MIARRKRESHVNHERWLVSYADFITLLFAFFTAMYAISQVDTKRLKDMVVSVRYAFSKGLDGSPGGGVKQPVIGESEDGTVIGGGAFSPELKGDNALRDLVEQFRELLDSDAQLKSKVKLRVEPRGLVLSLSEAGFFDSGSEALRKETLPVFEKLAGEIASHPNRIRIEGHTDNRPINTVKFPSNWELSGARAASLAKYLVFQYGMRPTYVSISGYGEFHPVASNDTPEGRQMNRRVEVVLLSDPLNTEGEPEDDEGTDGGSAATQPTKAPRESTTGIQGQLSPEEAATWGGYGYKKKDDEGAIAPLPSTLGTSIQDALAPALRESRESASAPSTEGGDTSETKSKEGD